MLACHVLLLFNFFFLGLCLDAFFFSFRIRKLNIFYPLGSCLLGEPSRVHGNRQWNQRVHASRRGVDSELSGYLTGLFDSVHGKALLRDTLSACKDDNHPSHRCIYFGLVFIGY